MTYPVFRGVLVFFASACLLMQATAQNPQVIADVSPPVLAPNQVGTFSITVENARATSIPNLELQAPLTQVDQVRTGTQIQINNGVSSMVTTFEWPITCAQEGTFTIMPQKVEIGGRIVETQPVTVEVKAGAQGAKPDGLAAGQDNGMGEYEPILQLHMSRTEFYQGEIVPITATLYVPRTDRIQIRRVGLIEVEKSDLAVQRFPQQSEQSLQTLGRMRYIAYAFRSTVSALKAGKMKVGPAKMELVLDLAVTSGRNFPFGLLQMEQRKVEVQAIEIPITVLPLPQQGKPPGFSGAVGDFSLSATLTDNEAEVGDPLAVDIMIEGQGNFDAIEAPKLSQAEGWKVYPPKRYNVDTGDPNTADLINRKVGFNQILVPEKVMNEIPAFEFSFFSTRTKEYVSLRSQPIAVTIKPGAAPVTAASAPESKSTPSVPAADPPPEADITDILTTLPPQARWAVASTPLLSSRGYLVVNLALFVLFLGILTFYIWQRLANSRPPTLKAQARRMLGELEQPGLGESEFFRRAAAFVHWAEHGEPSPATRAILERYEALNFTPGTTPSQTAVDPAERIRVLEVLRTIKLTEPRAPSLPARAAIGLLLALFAPCLQAAPEHAFAAGSAALEKGDFAGAEKSAAALVEEGHLAPEVFTLLGHAKYKQGTPGLAAMWYERAKLFPGNQAELRQNLRHIGEKTHYFTWNRNESLERFGYFLSRNAWVLLGTLGAWCLVLGAGILVVTKSPLLRIFAWSALPSGLCLLVLAIVGWQARPSYDDLQPLAFVTAPKADAHTAASNISGRVIPLPQGSVVKRLDERGKWTYVAIPQANEDLRGWIPTHELEPFWPFDPAKLP